VEDSSKGEHVTRWLQVNGLGKLDDLGGHVAGSATAKEEVFREVDVGGETKVNDHGF
jgi:hypothetical protein